METILKQITVAEVVEQTWVLWTLLQGLFVVEFSDLPLFPQVSDNSQTMVGGRIRRVYLKHLLENLSCLIQFSRVSCAGRPDGCLPRFDQLFDSIRGKWLRWGICG